MDYNVYDPELLPAADEKDEDLFPPKQEGITWEHAHKVRRPHFEVDDDCPF